MVLILSDDLDYSTTQVMNWLSAWSVKILRINPSDKIFVERIKIGNNGNSNIVLRSKNVRFNLNDIDAYWYRRGSLTIDTLIVEATPEILKKISGHLNEELATLSTYIHFILLGKKSIGSFLTSSLNKLIVLELAQRCGLKIPATLITSSKEQVSIFQRRHPIITKAISETIMLMEDDGMNLCYTNQVSEKDIEEYGDTLFPSLMQNDINKQFELRIFFLNDEFYSMAIFSQLDAQTSSDFRKYSFKNPNRTVPYQLPKQVERKLSKFMKQCKLNTGSIDMIVTTENEYVFLEVNPIGQYGMTSQPCNYNLDFKIAKYLCPTI